MATQKQATKKPRPMYSGSKPFEAGYKAFVNDVFENNVRSVEKSETDEARCIILAGCRRIRCDKKTGLLHAERLHWDSEASEGQWRAEKSFPVGSFWVGGSEILSAIQYSWHWRLERFLPSAENCFPNGLPKRVLRKGYGVNARVDELTMMAAKRRLGGKEYRDAAVRTFVGLLWKFLVDREVLSLCHAYFGRRASLDDYNLTLRRQADLRSRASETPNLTRLIGAYVKQTSELRLGRNPIPQNILALAKKELFLLEQAPKESRIVPLFPQEPLSPAGWRYLANTSAAVVHRLCDGPFYGHDWDDGTSQKGVHFAPILNLLAKTGEHPPLAFIKWALSAVLSLEATGMPEPDVEKSKASTLRFLRLAAQKATWAKKKGCLKSFISGDLALAWDWFRSPLERVPVFQDGRHNRTPLQPLPDVQKNATWASIMRTQHEWHAQRQERQRRQQEANRKAWQEHIARQEAKTWKSALPACSIGEVSIVPITTGKELRVEAKTMDHCVDGYIDVCDQGRSRIFSLRHNDSRATLELARTGKRNWQLRQVFGPGNTKVSREIAAAAKELLKRYKQADARKQKAPELTSSSY